MIIHSIEDPLFDRVGGYLLGLDFVFVFPLITLALTVYQTNDELSDQIHNIFGPDPSHGIFQLIREQ